MQKLPFPLKCLSKIVISVKDNRNWIIFAFRSALTAAPRAVWMRKLTLRLSVTTSQSNRPACFFCLMLDKYACEAAARIRVDAGVSVGPSTETRNSQTIELDNIARAVMWETWHIAPRLLVVSKLLFCLSWWKSWSYQIMWNVSFRHFRSLSLTHISAMSHTAISAHSWPERRKQFMSPLKDLFIHVYFI